MTNINKKQKKIILGISIPLAIILIMVIACVIYVEDYYCADETVKEYISGTVENVTVDSSQKNEIIFKPSEDNDLNIGLIFYPGGKVEYTAYAPLMSKLASDGITCVLVKMIWNLAIMDVNRADGIQEQFSNIEKWYIGGHSLGGAAASMYLEKNIKDYSGLILLASYSTVDFSQTDLEVISIYGSNDGVMKKDTYNKYIKNLPSMTEEIVIEGGCHAYFGSYGKQKGDGAATLTNEEQQNYTKDCIVNWINNDR